LLEAVRICTHSRAIDTRCPRRACRQARSRYGSTTQGKVQILLMTFFILMLSKNHFPLHPQADNNGFCVILTPLLLSNLLQMSRFPPGTGCTLLLCVWWVLAKLITCNPQVQALVCMEPWQLGCSTSASCGRTSQRKNQPYTNLAHHSRSYVRLLEKSSV
jgi:hypothetical protein